MEAWPQADRLAWESACKPRAGWKPGGVASHQRDITNADLQRRYGYFLQFCKEQNILELNTACLAHVTETNVSAYVAYASTIWSSVTCHMTLQKLWQIVQLLQPSGDWQWLIEIVLDLKSVAAPSRRRPIVSARAFMKMGHSLCEEGKTLFPHDRKKGSHLMRDGLILSLLSACPLRARNFAHLELGTSLRFEQDTWWIVLRADETKNKRADTRCVPDYLVPSLEAYLLSARPTLLKVIPEDMHSKTGDLPHLKGPLWVSFFGRPLDEQGLHMVTTRRTREAFGFSVNPHAFRAAAATTAAWEGSAMPHMASALLQHSDPSITDKHYNRVRSFEAAAAYQKMLRSL